MSNFRGNFSVTYEDSILIHTEHILLLSEITNALLLSKSWSAATLHVPETHRLGARGMRQHERSFKSRSGTPVLILELTTPLMQKWVPRNYATAKAP